MSDKTITSECTNEDAPHEPEMASTDQTFRKYESAMGESKCPVERQDSLMRHVYVRMKEKDLTSLADTLAPTYVNVDEGNGSQQKMTKEDSKGEDLQDTMTPLSAKKTLCLNLSFSLRGTMTSAFGLLMTVGLILMIVIPSLYTVRILRFYQE